MTENKILEAMEMLGLTPEAVSAMGEKDLKALGDEFVAGIEMLTNVFEFVPKTMKECPEVAEAVLYAEMFELIAQCYPAANPFLKKQFAKHVGFSKEQIVARLWGALNFPAR